MKFIPFVLVLLSTLFQFQISVSGTITSIGTPGGKASQCPVLNILNGRVKYRSKGLVVRIKCRNTYFLVGAKVLTCIQRTWDKPPPICLKPDCPKLPNPANGLWHFTYRGAVSTIICEASFHISGPRTIYCIDSRWNDTIPSCEDRNAEVQLSCDFETEDMCGWTQDRYHNFNWSRQENATPSGHIGTGPSSDHTLGRGFAGHYMYIESSSRLENDTARLLSPMYGPALSQNACFIFWYHMYGATTGTLRVNVKLLNDDISNMTTIFSKSGEQGDTWYGAVINLIQVDQPFQIVIEGIRGRGYASDIAIDDVKLTRGEDCEITTVPPTEFFIQTTLVTSYPTTAESGTVAVRTAKPFPTYLPPPPPPPLPPLSPILTVMTSPAPPYPYTPNANTSPMYTIIEREDTSPEPAQTTSNAVMTSFPYDTFSGTPITELSSINNDIPVLNTIITNRPLTTPSTKPTTQLYTTTKSTTTSITTKKPTTSSRTTTITTKKSTTPSTANTITKKKPTTSSATSTVMKSTPLTTKSSSTIASTSFPTSIITKPDLTTPRRSAFVPAPTTKRPWIRTTGMVFTSSIIKAPAPSSHTKGIIIISLIVLIVAVLAAVIIFIAARRRIKLKRRNEMSEDSDVRFLTSDEVLDFNLARPAEDDL